MKAPNLAWMLLLALVAAPAVWSAPAPGTPAPDFTLPDQNGKPVSLSDFRGKWIVLYFYPKDDTPGCTKEACEFRDNIFAFREANAVILGISVDDVRSHERFASEYRLPFSILADSEKQVSRDYGVLHRAFGVLQIARRETFVIDPRGRIARHYRDVNPETHSRQVLADIKSMQSGTLPAAAR
jgi:peroxiredoxin Q/BCP